MKKHIHRMKNFLLLIGERNIAFFICFIILMWRSKYRLLETGLWAEDGSVFLYDYLHLGPKSILISYAGYFHTIPRLVAYFAGSLSNLEYYPIITAVICILLTSYVFSFVASDRFTTYIRSSTLRVLLGVSLCFTPGLGEIAANLANIHWICYLFLWLLIIQPTNKTWSWFDFILAVLCIASTGEAIVLLPILSYRIFIQNHWGFKSKESGLLLFLIISITTNMSLSQGREWNSDYINLIHQAVPYFIWFSSIEPYRIIFESFGFTLHLDNFALLSSGLILIMLTIYFSFYKTKSETSKLLVLAYLCCFGVIYLSWLVRPASLDFMKTIAETGDTAHRYRFIIAPFSIIFWTTALSNLPIMRYFSPLPILFLVMQLTYPSQFYLDSWKSGNWSAFSEKVSANQINCTGQVVKIGISPNPWKVSYDPRRDKKCKKPKRKVSM